jgi:glucokinase
VARRIGIDLGGTKVLGVVVDGGEVVAKSKQKTPTSGGPDGVVETIASVVEELGGVKGDPIGVGAPGVVDADAGIVSRAPNLPGWNKPFPLAEALGEALGAKVRVDNDVNVATLAEHQLGSAKGVDDVLAVFVGTGVGGGLVLDGRLRRGPFGITGEIGHTTVHADGRRCGCGGIGHLEAYAGRAGLEAEARRLAADEDRHSTLLDIAGDKRMTSSVFAKALDQSDPVAVELIDEAVAALGLALSNAAALLDLSLVVLGGGLAHRLGDAFAGRVEEAVRSRLFAPTPLRVVPAALGDEAGAIGASLLGQG